MIIGTLAGVGFSAALYHRAMLPMYTETWTRRWRAGR